jgi:hypothetical protein
MKAAFTSWKIEERHILRRRARETILFLENGTVGL